MFIHQVEGNVEPAGIIRIIPCFYPDLGTVNQRHIGTAHNPGAGVTARVAEGIQLFHIYLVQTGFFHEFSPGRLLRGLIRPYKAAGQGPGTKIRMNPSLD